MPPYLPLGISDSKIGVEDSWGSMTDCLSKSETNHLGKTCQTTPRFSIHPLTQTPVVLCGHSTTELQACIALLEGFEPPTSHSFFLTWYSPWDSNPDCRVFKTLTSTIGLEEHKSGGRCRNRTYASFRVTAV